MAVYWANRCVLSSDTPAIKFAPTKTIAWFLLEKNLIQMQIIFKKQIANN